MNNDKNDELEVTNDEEISEIDEELADIESKSKQKISKLRDKITRLEDEKQSLSDELHRSRADFLNARKRLEEAREADKIRYEISHILELLPLCDSFDMAMSNKEVWEKADKSWRTGIEGIRQQLQRILDTHKVKEIAATGHDFDPHRHEAISTEEVTDPEKHDQIISVVQKGYEMNSEIIRPAKVITGDYKQ
jgi:molecular chaperone GrpE